MKSYIIEAKKLENNPKQKQAFYSESNCVILAGPGSGKSFFLTLKMAKILSENSFSPRGVACITYNKECAQELKSKLLGYGIQTSKNILISTAHSFCIKAILSPIWNIVSHSYPPEIKLSIKPEEGKITFDQVLDISIEFLNTYPWLPNLIRARFPWLLIDEYQDFDPRLHQIVQILCFQSGIKFIAVGDKDQSIYGFLKARPQLLMELYESNEVEGIEFDINYRCSQEIIDFSKKLLEFPPSFKTALQNATGSIYKPIGLNNLEDESRYICDSLIPHLLKDDFKLEKIAILYPTAKVGGILAKQLDQRELKYIRVDGHSPFKRTQFIRWIEDCAKFCKTGNLNEVFSLLSYWKELNYKVASDDEWLNRKRSLIKFLLNPNPKEALIDWIVDFENTCKLSEILKLDTENIDEFDNFNKFCNTCRPQGVLGNYSFANFAGSSERVEYLNLITIHSSKGLEFDAVILLGVNEGLIPSLDNYTGHPQNLEESKRLLYVAITRAKRRIYITFTKGKASRFLNELYPNKA